MNYFKNIYNGQWILLLLIGWVFLNGCNLRSKRTDLDTPDSGTIHISVDETFRPVIDSQITAFEGLNPNAKIIAEYKTEAECFKDLRKDSTRMIIVTRGLNDKEESFYRDSLEVSPVWSKIAFDAVAVIVNNEASDSIFTLAKLRGILDGTTADKQIAVFAGMKGSSSLRFIEDSVLRGRAFDPKKVFAQDSSIAVIKYVEKNKNAIGFVGVSWIGNPEDTSQLSFLTKVKIASLECVKCDEPAFVKPYQANIMRKKYPLVRGLFYILKENYTGLGTGFSNFLDYEKGQLIFRRAYLGPGKLNFTIRTATTQ